MSDDERGYSEEPAGETPAEDPPVEQPPAEESPAEQAEEHDGGPTEAMRQMEEAKQRRSEREQEELREYEEMRRAEKEKEEEEIRKLKEKRELRKVERAEEEKRLAEQRAIEESRRKTEEEERRKKKDEEKSKKMELRAVAMKEAEKLRNPPKPNFIIQKRGGGSVGNVVKAKEDLTKSKEQLEEEKKAILSQRVQTLSVDGFSSDQLSEKAKELYNQIYRLESEKYDLEERFKRQQYDMMELAERARQMNKGGKGKNLSRMQEADDMASKIPGAPPKVVMFSKYERQKDQRSYDQKKVVFRGPTWAPETERILPGEAPEHAEEEEEEAEEDEE